MIKGIASHRTGSLNNRIERNYMKSVTIPDRTMTMRQLIERHQSGGTVKTFSPVFTDSELLPDNFERMDNLERAKLLKDLGQFVVTTRGRLMTARQAYEQEQKRLLKEVEENNASLAKRLAQLENVQV